MQRHALENNFSLKIAFNGISCICFFSTRTSTLSDQNLIVSRVAYFLFNISQSSKRIQKSISIPQLNLDLSARNKNLLSGRKKKWKQCFPWHSCRYYRFIMLKSSSLQSGDIKFLFMPKLSTLPKTTTFLLFNISHSSR